MNQKVLVTGGLGYIGSHTVVELISKGYEVVILDNLSGGNTETLSKVEKITGVKLKLIEGDVTDVALVEKIFRENKFDSVIHLAGFKSVDERVQTPLLYYQNNLTGTLNLVSTMIANGVNKIIFSSSAKVYGSPAILPITEDFPLSPITPYATTKLAIEGALEDAVRANPDFCAVILRYFNTIGAHPSGLIGESLQDCPTNIIPQIVQTAAGLQPEFHIHGDDYKTSDGTGVRDYIHVVDLALGHIAALEKVNKHGLYIYNLGTGKGTSVLELLAAFEKAVGKKIPYKICERAEGDIDASFANCDKALRELGWKTERGIYEMCKSAWMFYMLSSLRA